MISNVYPVPIPVTRAKVELVIDQTAKATAETIAADEQAVLRGKRPGERPGERTVDGRSHGLRFAELPKPSWVEAKILLFCVCGWRFAFLAIRSVDPGIFQRLHLEVVYASPLQWQSPSIASLRDLDLLNDRRPPSQDEGCSAVRAEVLIGLRWEKRN